MQKLLTILNAMLKHQTPWQAQAARACQGQTFAVTVAPLSFLFPVGMSE
jgi:ubiquinone biosynthesis protein UbiJ